VCVCVCFGGMQFLLDGVMRIGFCVIVLVCVLWCECERACGISCVSFWCAWGCVLNMGGGFRYMVCVVFGCVMSWCFVWKWDIWHEKCVVLCFLCVSFWCAWGCGHGDMRR